MSKLNIIETNAGVENLILYLEDKEYVALDTETTGVHVGAEIVGYSVCASEDEAFYVITAKWDGAKLIYLETKDSASIFMKYIKSKQIMGHNFLFDALRIEENYKVSLIDSCHTDTMVLAHLLDENRRIGLKELALDIFGESATEQQKAMKESVIANGGQLTKANYEMYKADSQLLAKYGAQDALLTFKLFNHFIPQLYKQGLDKFFYEDESMPLLRTATYELNKTGLNVDLPKLAALKKQLEAECLEAKAFIYQEIDAKIRDKYPATTKKNLFNIGSSSQLAWLIFGEYGLEFGTLTDAGKAVCRSMGLKLPYALKAKRDFINACLQSKDDIYAPETSIGVKITKAKKIKDPWAYIKCDKKTLQSLAPKYKWIEKLLEYQRKTKIITTYIKGIQTRVQYGVIHPSFLQTGTTSGRYASRNPNLQNLPRNDQRVKECFVSRPGKVFVSADYSQLEPRVFSYYSGDTRLMQAFDGKTDFYSVVGMAVYAKTDCTPQKEGSPEAFGIKYKKLRDDAKTIALARAYGASAFQLAPTIGKSAEDTQTDLDNYDKSVPGVRKMMIDAHELAKEHGYVTSLFGRPRRMPDAKKINKIYGKKDHSELPYEARSLLNLACNHRIQSTGASIVNRASIRFLNDCKDLNIEAKLVCQIHDELVVECDENYAEEVSLLLQNAMENTTLLDGVLLEAVPRITKNMAK